MAPGRKVVKVSILRKIPRPPLGSGHGLAALGRIAPKEE